MVYPLMDLTLNLLKHLVLIRSKSTHIHNRPCQLRHDIWLVSKNRVKNSVAEAEKLNPNIIFALEWFKSPTALMNFESRPS